MNFSSTIPYADRILTSLYASVTPDSLAGGIMFPNSPTSPLVRPLVRYQTCGKDILKKWTDFDTNWDKWYTTQKHETIISEGQEVKGQGHTGPKLHLLAWERRHA